MLGMQRKGNQEQKKEASHVMDMDILNDYDVYYDVLQMAK